MVSELELPDTTFVRDIDNRVFQSIVAQCLAETPGITLLEGNILDNLLGRGAEGYRGIEIEQNSTSHSVAIKVQVNICYGLSIPEKSEEIQRKVIEAVTDLTGLHVASVHVIFKGVVDPDICRAEPREPDGDVEETD